MNEVDLNREIYNQALQCGFDNCGILSIDAVNGFEELFQKRMKDIPQSRFFYEHMEALQETKKRFSWAKSIVILTYNYGKYRYPTELQGKYAKAFFLEPEGNSTQGYDMQRLEQWFAKHSIRAEGGNQFQHMSVGPLRHIAAKAGLGIVRKNNFFYTEAGSYHSLIGYVIDKECELIQTANVAPCSEKCDLCQKACKTGALEAAYSMNPLKCVSYWTTFGNSDIPEGLTPEMFEGWICGCDNCQDSCPYNHRHDWNVGEHFSNLQEIAALIEPQNYEHLSDTYLIEQVIPKTARHLQVSDVPALRKNAKRSLEYQRAKPNLN